MNMPAPSGKGKAWCWLPTFFGDAQGEVPKIVPPRFGERTGEHDPEEAQHSTIVGGGPAHDAVLIGPTGMKTVRFERPRPPWALDVSSHVDAEDPLGEPLR